MLDVVQSTFLRLHQRVYQATGGRIGHGMIGVPTLLLYTTGSKTGQRRTAALVYATDDDDYLVVASNGGSDRPPAWLGNLRATPAVEVQVRDRVRPATARIVSSSRPIPSTNTSGEW